MHPLTFHVRSARAAACDVSYSSNFFSVVVRDADSLAELGHMNAEVSYKMDGEGVSGASYHLKDLELIRVSGFMRFGASSRWSHCWRYQRHRGWDLWFSSGRGVCLSISDVRQRQKKMRVGGEKTRVRDGGEDTCQEFSRRDDGCSRQHSALPIPRRQSAKC